ncbi:hypothetical protein [Pseudomonas sp. DWP3-1-2]|uniref:hypothetical protein n=1 Tax=Pseudomonas sp. DWP3-1-2 TaxID=2804645 RepID=UPI003CFB0A4D
MLSKLSALMQQAKTVEDMSQLLHLPFVEQEFTEGQESIDAYPLLDTWEGMLSFFKAHNVPVRACSANG